MALPLALGLLAVAVGQGPRRHISQRQRGWGRWRARLSAIRLNQAMLFGSAALAILLGLIFTRSRTGVLMAMLGILLCTLLFSTRLGGRNVYGLLGAFTAVGIGLASLIGLAPVLDRFTLQDHCGCALADCRRHHASHRPILSLGQRRGHFRGRDAPVSSTGLARRDHQLRPQ